MNDATFNIESAFDQIRALAKEKDISSQEDFNRLVDSYFDDLVSKGQLEDFGDIADIKEVIKGKYNQQSSSHDDEDLLASDDYLPVDLNDHLPKLIRDKVPEIIEEHGKKISYKVISGKSYDHALRKKLIEETAEIKDAKTKQELVDQVSDVLELIQTFVAFHTLDINEIKSHQKRKKEERGGYEKGILLTSLEE